MSKHIDDILKAERYLELNLESMQQLCASVKSFVSTHEKIEKPKGAECKQCAHAILLQYSEEPAFCLCSAHNNQQDLEYWCESFRRARRTPKIQKRIRFVTDIYNH